MRYTRSEFPDDFLFGLETPDEPTEGFDCVRVPVRWVDTYPDGNEALDRIDRLTDALLEQGQRPCPLLDHSALPPVFEDRGGWRNRDIAGWYADFAETVVKRIGDRVFNMATGPIARTEASDRRTQARGLHHRLLAQGLAIQALRGFGMTNLGATYCVDGSEALLDVVVRKAIPNEVLDELGSLLPEGWRDDLETIAEPLDWCGLSFARAIRENVLQRLARESTRELPLIVSAAAGSDTGLANDLDAVCAALAKSVPVCGFFLRSGNAVDSLRDTLVNGRQPAPWTRPCGNLHAHWNLVADIGGTNTRLGVVTNGVLTELRRHPTGSLDELRAALHDLRNAVGTDPRAVVAAGAGPVRDGRIRLTNADLDLSEAELARATGAKHTFVINDFTAAAWSVAEVTGSDVEVLQGATAPPAGTRLVVGPGTGLGVGALLYSEGHYHTVSGEGGHMGLAPRHRDEVEVFAAARQIAPECFFDDSLVLEAEMFLSGTGLPILYQSVAMAGGVTDPPARSARDILQDAKNGTDDCAVKTARMFTEHLGAIMGDLAVALVPAGGVFLVGGVAEKKPLAVRAGFSACLQRRGAVRCVTVRA